MKRLQNMQRKWSESIRRAVSKIDNEYYRMKMVLMIFQLFGLAPCVIDRTSNGRKVLNVSLTSPKPRLIYSRLGCAYTIVLNVILIGIWIVMFPRLYDDEYPNKSQLTVMLEVILSISANLIAVTLRLRMVIKQDSALKLFNRFTGIDHAVVPMASPRNFESNGLFFVLLFLSQASIWTILVLCENWCFGDLAIVLFTSILPAMTMNWLIIQYVIMIKLIERRFQVLNRFLLDTSSVPGIRSSPSLIIGDNSMRPAYSRKILAFRQTYASLYIIGCDVSEFYSLPILLSIVCLFCGIIYTLYYAIIPVVLQGQWHSPCILFQILAWLIAEMLPIVMLVEGTDRTNLEMSKSADVVHTVLARASTSKEDKAELRAASLELYRRNIKFTACGLITLDRTLLHSIFSSITMYLIIIIQLQLAGVKKSANGQE